MPRFSFVAALLLASLSVACSSMPPANVVPPPPSNLNALPEDSPARPFLGNYRYTGGDEERARVEKAIDDAVSTMTPIIRGFARSRLVAANGVAKDLEFLADTQWFEVRADGHRYVSHYDGTTYRVETVTGDVMDLHYKFGTELEQTFADTVKARINTFELQDQNHLIMHVRVRADVLPKEIVYDLTYERTAMPPAASPAASEKPAGETSQK